MAIEFRCNRCNKLLRVDESSAGKKARCPECTNIQDVPNTSQVSSAPANDYPYYGQSTPAQTRPAAVPMSAPASFNPPTSPAPSYSAPASNTSTPPPSTPTYGSAGNPFAPQPSVTMNPYSDQASANPFSASQPGYSAPGYSSLGNAQQRHSQPGAAERARSRARPPAIVLMVFSLLYFLVVAFFLLGLVASIDKHDEEGTVGCAVLMVMYGVAGVVPAVSGLMMMSMRAHGLCVAGMVLSMITGFFSLCLPVFGIAIWALVVLLDPEVRAAFR